MPERRQFNQRKLPTGGNNADQSDDISAPRRSDGLLAAKSAPSFAQGRQGQPESRRSVSGDAIRPRWRWKKLAPISASSPSGRIDIQFFPNAQLGSDAAMLTQVRSGALDMMTASGISMQVVAPIAGISGMAFAFTDYDHVWQAMDGDLGAGDPRRPRQGRPLCLPENSRQRLSQRHDQHTSDQCGR